MSKLIALIFSSLLGTVVLAAAPAGSDYGFVLGFRSQSGDTSSTTENTQSGAGIQLGATGSFQINGALNFRTGLMYVERPIKLASIATTGSADIKMTYFDIPLTLSFKFEDYAAIYGGLILSTNLSNSVSGTGTLAALQNPGVKSIITPITIGAAFRFAPQIGADVFFETAPGDVSQNYKSYRAVGANLLYFFD